MVDGQINTMINALNYVNGNIITGLVVKFVLITITSANIYIYIYIYIIIGEVERKSNQNSKLEF